jgi:hypothetical protein
VELDGGQLGLEVERVEEGEELMDVDVRVLVAGREDGVDLRLCLPLGGGEVGEGGDGVGGAFFVGGGHHIWSEHMFDMSRSETTGAWRRRWGGWAESPLKSRGGGGCTSDLIPRRRIQH